MCRMVGYIGPPLAPAELLQKPPHSLYVQSYKPREMTSGVVNADGWGAALWLDDPRREPALYRSAQPIWADPNLALVSDRLSATAALAAVRSATPGIAYDLACVQPFARGRIAFLHNGFVTGWQQDRKSTRLNSSHSSISYAVFCLKKKKKKQKIQRATKQKNKKKKNKT